MKKEVMAKIEVLTNRANQDRGKEQQQELPLKEGPVHTRNSLAENIHSKEQADAFRRMLHSL